MTTHQTLLITGGTGFIGRALCRFLVAQGYTLTVLTRNPERARLLLPEGTRCVVTLEDIPEDQPVDGVINLAGESIFQRWTAKARAEIVRSRVETTRTLLRWMQGRAQKPSVFISGSAIGYYGTHPTTQFSETTPFDTSQGGPFAHHVCTQWEAAAQDGLPDETRLVLLRTGVVLEEDGGALAQMLPPFRFGLGGPIGNGKQWFSWIHRHDLLRLMLFCLQTPELSGPVNATAPEPASNKHLAATLGEALSRPAFLPMPGFAVKLLFGKMGEELLLQGQHVTPQKALEHGFMFEHATLEKTLQDIL